MITSTDHRMVRCKVTLNLKEKLFRIKPNISTVKEQSDEFAITIQNKYSQLVDEMNGRIESLNDNLTNVVLESASGKASKENSSKRLTVTKDLIMKHNRMVLKTIQDKIEVVELSKTIYKRKTNHI